MTSTSTEEGTCAISFADGSGVSCDPDPDYEAWTVVGGDPLYLVICAPGGELTIFDSSYIPSPEEAQRVVDDVSELFGQNFRLREITARGSILVDPESKEPEQDNPSAGE